MAELPEDAAIGTANGQRRNRNFEETHRMLIETAVEVISRDGLDSLSVSALARETGINRSTVYYHFDSRDALIVAVKSWSARQLVTRYQHDADRNERLGATISFLLDRPEVARLWIEDLLEPGDIRVRYPEWDQLLGGLAKRMRLAEGLGDVDIEVFCSMLLTAIFVAPRIFKNSIRPDENNGAIVARFAREQHRVLTQLGFYPEPVPA